jgi:hypothetical protein
MKYIDTFSPYGLDPIKYNAKDENIPFNTIALGKDNQEWILIKKNNVRIWKRTSTYVTMQKEKFANNVVLTKEKATLQTNPVIKKQTDYNIFQKYKLSTMEKGTGRSNLDLVNVLWKTLKANKEEYVLFFQNIKNDIN